MLPASIPGKAAKHPHQELLAALHTVGERIRSACQQAQVTEADILSESEAYKTHMKWSELRNTVNLFDSEIRRCKVYTFDHNVYQPESWYTGGFGDMLAEPGRIERMHDYIVNEIKDLKLAHDVRLIACHFRDVHPGGNKHSNTHRAFGWEAEKELLLEDRLSELWSKLLMQRGNFHDGDPEFTKLDRMINVAHTLAGKARGSDLGVSREGALVLVKPPIFFRDLWKPQEIDTLCQWVEQNHPEDASLPRDIRNFASLCQKYDKETRAR